MSEEFLHYIWQYKLYYPQQLQTTLGHTIEVIHPGTKNTDGGPDFFNAKIKIDNTIWAGNVEIHQHEDEWFKHKHHKDAAYDNVILHVVDQLSSTTVNSRNRTIAVCQLKYPNEIKKRYKQLLFNDKWISCADKITKVNRFNFEQWLNRLLIEKLEEKSHLVDSLLESTKNDWDQAFFILLSRSFGFGLNGLPFEIMARQTNLNILLKHADNIFQLEAILFGQAGFLSSPKQTDAYTKALVKEYAFLRRKYQIAPIEQHLWKFLRLRPSNFPTIRLAQLAGIIHNTKGKFEILQKITQIDKIYELLAVETSEYWQDHYQLGIKTPKKTIKQIGRQSIQRIIYNTIIPYRFIYESKHNNEIRKEKIIDFLYHQAPEKNRILSNWEVLGIKIENEAFAQALIFLKNSYCNHKKCLNCRIGHDVLCKP